MEVTFDKQNVTAFPRVRESQENGTGFIRKLDFFVDKVREYQGILVITSSRLLGLGTWY